MFFKRKKTQPDARTLELRKYRIFSFFIAAVYPVYYYPTKALTPSGAYDSIEIRVAIGIYFALLYIGTYYKEWVAKNIDALFTVGGCCMTLHLYFITYKNNLSPTFAWAMTGSLVMLATSFFTIRAQLIFIATVILSSSLVVAHVETEFPKSTFLLINCSIALLMGALFIYRIRITDALKLEVKRRTEAEQKLKEHQAALLTAAKMTALGEMAGGIAHEINNPLAVIKGHVEILNGLLSRTDVDAEQKAFFTKRIHTILGAIDRVAKIIQGLRVYARNADSDPLVDVNVQQLLTEVIEFCRTRYSQLSIDFDINGSAKDVLAKLRPLQISQVILNLIHNSFDAVQNLNEKWVKMDVTALNGFLTIRVTDSGSGITPQVAERMLDPFFTTKEVGKGQGLGLSVSKGIIENHEGTLTYDSFSKNTSFVINLPIGAFAKVG